jgi:hypothetical protein
VGTLLTLAGIAALVVGLWDMYHSLLHPSGTGPLSSRVQSGVWAVSKLGGHRLGFAVGPAAMVAVVAFWVVLQTVGWALVYLPHIPQGFTYSSGIAPVEYPDVVEALYVSLVTLSTLGYGDMVATDDWIRLASPLEALTGFALLTAALTWFTQVYQPLSRRRTLALELKSLADVAYAEGIGGEDPASVARVLDGLAADVMKSRVDLTQHSESYYFQEKDPQLSLARQLPYAIVLRDRALQAPAPAVRSSARRLGIALDQLADKLREGFLHRGEDAEDVFAAYAEDHGRRARRFGGEE